MKSLARLAALVAIAGPLIVGMSTAANASVYTQCTDMYQVGNTAYIADGNGGTAASVKQYWSPRCAQNFAYVYVWQSFRNTHTSWSVDVAEVYSPGDAYYVPEGEVFTQNTTGSDFWSHGYSGGGQCTFAEGTLFWGNMEGFVQTSTRCG